MSVRGIIKKGVVVLPPDAHFAEGQQVEISAVPASPDEPFALRETAAAIPAARDLPDDLSSNLDYYVHSHLHKQQPRHGRWIPAGKSTPELTGRQMTEFAGKLLELAGETRNLPSDLSTNHDHYLHGLPRR